MSRSCERENDVLNSNATGPGFITLVAFASCVEGWGSDFLMHFRVKTFKWLSVASSVMFHIIRCCMAFWCGRTMNGQCTTATGRHCGDMTSTV